MKRMVLVMMAFVIGVVATADDRKATISTRKGDTIEGAFRGATATDVTVEIAGQPVKVPIDTVRYISFEGQLTTGAGGEKSARAGSLDDAFAALAELDSVLQVGLLRDQYSEKLVALLPRVNAFVGSEGEDWADVRLLLRNAIAEYQGPLGPITAYSHPWSNAAMYWRRASRFVEYAKTVSKRDGERQHQEHPAIDQDGAADSLAGRLGHGDAPLPATVDAKAEGHFSESYVIALQNAARLRITQVAGAGPGAAMLYLMDEGGKRLEKKDAGEPVERVLNAGRYTLWVASITPTEYKLAVTRKPVQIAQ